jgi:hypothetical protein
VSTEDASSDGHKETGGTARDLRDRPLFRIAALLAVLLAAFAATKSCARQQDKVNQDEAVAIARKQIDFEPDRVQIRYLPQGIPPVYYWAVSFSTLEGGNLDRVQVVLVNATTGAVKR